MIQLTRIDPFQANGIQDSLVAPPSSFLQTPFWAEFKASQGWTPHYFIVTGSLLDDNANGEGFFLSVLVKRLSPLASLAYVPLGPDFRLNDPERQTALLSGLARALVPFLPPNAILVRFDPPWGTVVQNSHTESSSDTDSTQTSASKRIDAFPRGLPIPARRASTHIQPPDTVILDLRLPKDALLAQMKAKWRYNVKLGEKKGLSIRLFEGNDAATEGLSIFYGLYLETARRDGIAIHAKSYYAAFLSAPSRARASCFNTHISARVYVAEHEGQALASIITLFCGDEAVYLYGASSNEKRNLMPAYSLQWRAIMDAKEAGCSRYDFYGIPPTDDPSHPMHGLYRFKTGFGGSIVHRVGSWDIPLRQIRYSAYRCAESARTLWFKKIVKLFSKEIPRKS